MIQRTNGCVRLSLHDYDFRLIVKEGVFTVIFLIGLCYIEMSHYCLNFFRMKIIFLAALPSFLLFLFTCCSGGDSSEAYDTTSYDTFATVTPELPPPPPPPADYVINALDAEDNQVQLKVED